MRKEKNETENELAALRQKYSDEYPKVQEAIAKIKKIDSEINALVASGQFTKLKAEDLPDDPAFLLKLIILQNQRIIELLESQKKQ